MPTFLLSYITSTFIFLGLDFVWLSLTMAPLYKNKLGPLLLDKPNFMAAGVFYLLYGVGIAAFAVLPGLDQNSWFRALWGGALLGLLAYGTYDLSNLATLKNWSLSVSVIDMAWGTFATAMAALISYCGIRYFR